MSGAGPCLSGPPIDQACAGEEATSSMRSPGNEGGPRKAPPSPSDPAVGTAPGRQRPLRGPARLARPGRGVRPTSPNPPNRDCDRPDGNTCLLPFPDVQLAPLLALSARPSWEAGQDRPSAGRGTLRSGTIWCHEKRTGRTDLELHPADDCDVRGRVGMGVRRLWRAPRHDHPSRPVTLHPTRCRCFPEIDHDPLAAGVHHLNSSCTLAASEHQRDDHRAHEDRLASPQHRAALLNVLDDLVTKNRLKALTAERS